MIEMMYKTNFIALVFTNAKQKVVIWDDYEKKNRTEITFKTDVKKIQLNKNMLAVVLENQTFVFSFMDLKLIESIKTGANPYGICGLA
jgi:hypothetical protein